MCSFASWTLPESLLFVTLMLDTISYRAWTEAPASTLNSSLRRNFLVSELNKIENIQCKQPGGAFYVFPKIKKENMNSVEISRYLLEKKFIATVPGSSFGKNGEGFLRVSYASTIENLEKFIVCLKDFMNE